MPKDLLLEVGLEEVPARFIRDASNQLTDKLVRWLEENRISHGEVKSYSTPRRLAVLIEGVAEKGADISEEVKGPSRKIAMDESGAWSKAAQGFARSQGVESEQLFFKELQGVEYVYASKNSQGVDTAAVLSESLTQLITSMSFPKNMRWGANELRFIRPIRWLVAMLGEEVVPLEIVGVKSGRVTRGHRFLGQETSIAAAADYAKALREQFVLVDPEERTSLIVAGIKRLEAERDWVVPMKEDLLEEVTFLVEYPTVLFGTFNPDFLQIPQDVLITSMREHQRYFPVLDGQGSLQPFFITVRNGNDVSLDVVARGNEKVLRARLSDAKFFYAEDQKQTIVSFVDRLETIVFHEELGTIGDKVRRIESVTAALADALSCDAEATADALRVAHICKFDLVTQMVYEFPELQGTMGEDYARIAGEKEAVAKGVSEHYKPRFSGDSSPASIVGTLVSIADKIDTIAGCFAIGIIPTGSQDPYALRRQAAGIVQMLLDHKLAIKLPQLFGIAVGSLEKAGLLKRPSEEVVSDMTEFFGLRIKNVLTEKGARYDVIEAVMGTGFDDVSAAVRKAGVLADATAQPDFKLAVDSFGRICNLAAKAEGDAQPDAALFTESVENRLFTAWTDVRVRYNERLEAGDEAAALQLLTGLKDAITAFFDGVMVMAEDARVRSNRLALLKGIAQDIKRFADFQKLVW